jgi:hypothetical protein
LDSIELTQADERSAWRMLVRLQRQSGRAHATTLANWLTGQPMPEQFTLAILRDAHTLLVETHDPGGAVEADVSALILAVPSELLSAALGSEPHAGWRREFLLAMVDRLTSEAAVRVVEIATAALGRPLALPVRAVLHAMLRRALAAAPGEHATHALRELLAGYVRAVSEESVHTMTIGFESLYDRRYERRAESRATPEAERILQLSIETGVAARVTWMALSELLDAGRGGDALGMLAMAPEQNAATHAIASRFATARELAALLREDPVDFSRVDLIVSVMGVNAAPTLLESLAESTSRTTRRGALDRLTRLGPGIVPFTGSRLRDTRWFVLRNMLALLRAVEHHMPAGELERFVTHTDARVRREAILLLIANPPARDRGIATGLKDADTHVLRAVLQELRQRVPDAGVPVLAKRLRDGDFPAELRVRALQLLGRSASTLALDALLHYAQAGRTLLGKPKLAPASSEMVAAVSGLAQSWRHDARARMLLEAAARSSDAEVVKAARPQPQGS